MTLSSLTDLRSFLEQSGKDFLAAFIGKAKMAPQCVAITMSPLSLTCLPTFALQAVRETHPGKQDAGLPLNRPRMKHSEADLASGRRGSLLSRRGES